MNGVISVMGSDRPGIIAKVSTVLFEYNANILDINQTVMRDKIFVMTLIADLTEMSCTFGELKERLAGVSRELGLDIKLQREEIFESMHTV